jgi:hypothetical protein
MHARIERQIEALIEVEIAVGRYRAVCSGDPDAAREEASKTGDAAPAGTPVPDGPLAPPGALADVLDGQSAPGAPAGGKRGLPGGQEADCCHPGASRSDADCSGATAPPEAVASTPAALDERACERCGASFAPNQRGGVVQRFCGVRCRRLAHQERRRPKPAPDGPEPPEALPELADILRTPMPPEPESVAVAKAPPAAPGRTGPERGYVSSTIANAPPIRDDVRAMVEQRRDREADQRFIEAGFRRSALRPWSALVMSGCALVVIRRRSCWGELLTRGLRNRLPVLTGRGPRRSAWCSAKTGASPDVIDRPARSRPGGASFHV